MTSLVHAFLHTLELGQPVQVCIFTIHNSDTTIYSYHFIVPDPCLSTPCDPNAECIRESSQSSNFSCSCNAPFTVGDGFNCSSNGIKFDIKYH